MVKLENSKKTKLGTRLHATNSFSIELILAMVGISAAAVALDVLVGGLMSYIYNGFSLQKSALLDGPLLFMVAAMLIWLPVAAVLYLRSRSDLDKQSFRQRNFFKIFNTAFCCVHLLAAVGLLIAAFATALYFSFNNAANMTWSQLLVTHSLPVVLASMVHVFVAMAFSRRIKMKRFLSVFFGLCLALTLVMLFVLLAGSGSVKHDRQKANDLSLLQTSINQYYTKNSSRLPDDINQLDLKDRSLSQSLANYTYSKKTDQAYELCADFATNTIETGNMTKAMRAPDSYEYYGDFTKHPKGRHCYNLAVYSPLLPEVPASDLPVNGSGMEPATAD